MKLTPQEKEKRKLERILIRDQKEKEAEEHKIINKKLKRCGIYVYPRSYKDYSKEQIRFKLLSTNDDKSSFLNLLHLSEEFETEDMEICLNLNYDNYDNEARPEVVVTIKNYKL